MNPLLALKEQGQSYWMDDLTREMLQDGSLKRRIALENLTGITSNPSIFRLAIGGSNRYDAQLAEAARQGRSSEQIYEELVTTDVRDACDLLRPVYEQTQGADGYVSLEVSPHLAYDSPRSIEEGRRLHAAVDRPNVMIKIPGTVECLPAIEQLLFEGINVNITLLFSVARYRAVSQAHQRALERRQAAGQLLDAVASVASFFLSRIDVLVDQLLALRIAPDGHSACTPHPKTLQGKVAVANAKLAYAQLATRLRREERWQSLAAAGARPQRLLWASTSTKNPKYHDLMYVEPLIGPHTVNTMPLKTIEAFADHGKVARTVDKGLRDAARVLRELRSVGIDMAQVTQQLENEAVRKFIEPFDKLLATIEAKRARYADHKAQDASKGTPALARAARQLRRDVIRMTTAAGSGHPTSCLSAAEIVALLFFEQMRWDPADAQARDVDTFILSKGHAAPILWAALSQAGASEENLLSLRDFHSTLEGHPTPNNPWVKVATGSLGQGLSAANGIALANRLDGIDARIYCLLGDGECSEGSVWEAAQFAALNGLRAITAIVDQNALGQSGPAPFGEDTSELAGRFRAFGWEVREVDGHDIDALREALAANDGDAQRSPLALVARTVKGKGVSFLEGKEGWHGKPLDREQCIRALAELGGDERCPAVEPRHVDRRIDRPPELSAEPSAEPRAADAHGARASGAGTEARPVPPGSSAAVSSAAAGAARATYDHGEKRASREAFGRALARLGEHEPQLIVLDADVMNSTYTKEFARKFPERFFQCYIAEQNMVGTALGLAVSGKTVVAATFACFWSRAYDFIRMAAHSRPRHLIFCGSHAGVAVGEDGPSQMGLEDVAMFRALGDSTVLCPSDAVSAERLTELALQVEGIVYLRTARPKTDVLYGSDDTFAIGGSKLLRSSENDRATLVAMGVAVFQALEAHEQLRAQGIDTRVIDAYSVKPLDVASLTRAARETGRVLVIEDHWIDGGLGDAVAAAVAGIAPVQRLAVTREPRSGTAQELFDLEGISAPAISRAVAAGVPASGH